MVVVACRLTCRVYRGILSISDTGRILDDRFMTERSLARFYRDSFIFENLIRDIYSKNAFRFSYDVGNAS